LNDAFMMVILQFINYLLKSINKYSNWLFHSLSKGWID